MVKFTTSDARTYLKWVCRKQCSHLDRYRRGASLFDGQRWYYIMKTNDSWELQIQSPRDFADSGESIGNYKIPDDCLLSKDRFKVFFKECYQNEMVVQDRNQTKTYLGARTKEPVYCLNGLRLHYEGSGFGHGVYGAWCHVFRNPKHPNELSKQTVFVIKTIFSKLTRHRFDIDFELDSGGRDYFPPVIELCLRRKDIKRSGDLHVAWLLFDEFDKVIANCLDGFSFGLCRYDKKKKLTKKDVRDFHKKQSVRSVKLLKKIKNIHEI